MSTSASTKGKFGKASTKPNNDADSIMPLLLATIGNPAISFKKMAAMDEVGRTESSLEHCFRKWRQKGREIAAQNPENAGTQSSPSAGTATTKKPRAAVNEGASGKGKGPIEQADVDDGEDETDEKARAVKQEPDEMDDINGEMLHPSIKGKATATKNTKKRATSAKVASAEDEVGEVPAKKAKVMKKGIAKAVKKNNAKACSGSEDEEAVSEDEEEVLMKPKGKGKGYAAAASGKGKVAAKPPGRAKAKKGKTEIPIHEDEDAGFDLSP